LERAGCYRVFTETASGARTDRPTLEQLLDQLRPGDTLFVWKLDRLGRSLRHLVDTVTGLAERDIGFQSLQEADSRWAGRRPHSWPPWRPALGHDRAQAAGGPGDVCVWPIQRGRNRHDARVSRASIYRHVGGASRQAAPEPLFGEVCGR
jgi:Resolvase, N terminal domain